MGNEGFIISVFSSDMEADQCTAGLFIVLPLDQLTCMTLYVLAVGLLMSKSELASHSEQNMSLDSEHTLDLASEIFLTFAKKQEKEKMVLLEHEKSIQV